MKGLTDEELDAIRKELRECKNPLFIYDDDADGTTSFLPLYRWAKEGKGIVVKSKPMGDESFRRGAEGNDPDKVVVVRMGVISEKVDEAVKRPVIWIALPQPLKLEGVKYFNPRLHQADIVYPTSNICYDVVQQDLWLAMVGGVGGLDLPWLTKN